MPSFLKKVISYGAACLIMLPTTVFATTSYDYVTTNDKDTIDMRYNPITNNFTMNYYEDRNLDNYDSWWLVVSDGPKPETTGIQMIIDEKTDTITAYSYAPDADALTNYQTGEYLAQFKFGDATLGEGFTLNVEELNNIAKELDPNATTISFSEDTGAGIWMKGGNGAPTYNDDGSIATWDAADGNNIFDKKNLNVDVDSHTITTYKPISSHYNRPSSAVPAPIGGMVLLTAFGLFYMKKRKAS